MEDQYSFNFLRRLFCCRRIYEQGKSNWFVLDLLPNRRTSSKIMMMIVFDDDANSIDDKYDAVDDI